MYQTSFFERTSHRDAAVRHIADGVLPLKFAYTGSAAVSHDSYARTDHYLSGIAAMRGAMSVLGGSARPARQPLDVVEIGPGNGLRTVATLRHLAENGRRCRGYLAMDFSRTLLGLATRRVVTAVGTRIRVSSGVWDIESGPTEHIARWRRGDRPVTVWFLGQTLGNVESEGETLGHLWSSLRQRDVLVVNVMLRQESDNRPADLAAYQTGEFTAAVLEPLRAAGIDLRNIDLDVGFVGDAVVGEVVFRRTVLLRGVPLPKGHRLRCFRSQRYERRGVLSALTTTGWSIQHAITDESGGQLLVRAIREGGRDHAGG